MTKAILAALAICLLAAGIAMGSVEISTSGQSIDTNGGGIYCIVGHITTKGDVDGGVVFQSTPSKWGHEFSYTGNDKFEIEADQKIWFSKWDVAKPVEPIDPYFGMHMEAIGNEAGDYATISGSLLLDLGQGVSMTGTVNGDSRFLNLQTSANAPGWNFNAEGIAKNDRAIFEANSAFNAISQEIGADFKSHQW